MVSAAPVQANKKATDTTPAEDLQIYTGAISQKRFPGVPQQEFANGVYSIDEVSRQSWEAIEEFPPYEPMIEEGETMWNTPFANGKGYADCFAEGPAQRKNYPYWDAKRKMVVTLPLAINECRAGQRRAAAEVQEGRRSPACWPTCPTSRAARPSMCASPTPPRWRPTTRARPSTSPDAVS